jgi:HEAT repeat protein
MTNIRAAIATALLAFLPNWNLAFAQDTQDRKDEAWSILRTGVNEKEIGKRAQTVRVLGLLQGNAEAVRMAQKALGDEKAEVRAAAATALGQMRSRRSIPKLEVLLSDKEPSVVLAAASALMTFKDQAAYDVYYEVLTGERKTGKGLIAGEKETLKDPKKLAEVGFNEGVGFIPFAGIGVSAFKTLRTDDVSPVRAAAAKMLAEDKDPQSGEALVQAAFEKSWIVRVAALESIAKRGDAGLLEGILPALADSNNSVRCTAAATVIRLSTVASASATKTQ